MTKKKRLRKESRKTDNMNVVPMHSPAVRRGHAPDFGQQEYYYVIGVGHLTDDPSSSENDLAFYYIEHPANSGRRVVPIFSTRERCDAYMELIVRDLQHPEVHMDMLESGGPHFARYLDHPRFINFPVNLEMFAQVLTMLGTRVFVLDPEQGENPVVQVGDDRDYEGFGKPWLISTHRALFRLSPHTVIRRNV